MVEANSNQNCREQQLDALIAEYYQAAEQGSPPKVEAFLESHPEFAAELREFFHDLGQIEAAAAPLNCPLDVTQRINRPHTSILSPGTAIRFFGDYEVLSVLGIGGMGVVYKTRQSRLKKIVALKMIKEGDLASNDQVERFLSEARAAATLEHPGIVAVHEVGQFQGLHYYTMDFLGGGSLAKLNRDEPVAARRAAELVKQLAEAMHYAHSQGIVHRDLKPSNVLLTVGGVPRITDFGLAKRLWSNEESIAATMTETGQVLGTAGYMSPEQAAGKTRLVGPAADIYALGAILYALITGRAPFVGESQADTIMQVIQNVPVSPRVLNPSISRDLDTICLKCLAKEPHDRYATAQHLADDLGRLLDGRPVMARPLSAATRSVRWCRRNLALTTMASALVVLIVFGLITLLVQHRSSLERQNQSMAGGIVDSLKSADTQEVPAIIRHLAEHRVWAEPYLDRGLKSFPNGSREKLNLSLAVLPTDDSPVEYLREQLLVVSASQFVVVRDALLPYRAEVREPLWLVALDANRPLQERFQAACALATYAPEDQRWSQISESVARYLVSSETAELVAWRRALYPAHRHLLPTLRDNYRDQSQREQTRFQATEALAEYLADKPAALVDLLADAEQFQFKTTLKRLDPVAAIPLAEAELKKQLPSTANESEKEQLARRQANLAIALLHWNAPAEAWTILANSPDLRARSYFIHWLPGRGILASAVLDRLKVEADVGKRHGLLLALGEFETDALSEQQRRNLIQELKPILQANSNAGLRAAAEWLLRHWGEVELITTVSQELSARAPQIPPIEDNEQNWFVNREGHVMVVLPMHANSQRFAISAHEVTGAQLIRFDTATNELRLNDWARNILADDLPCQYASWFVAAGYCNWLSSRQGIPESEWCYEPTPARHYAPGMKLKPNATSLQGYRLPTEAEWELACGAGTVTSRFFGTSDELLSKYAWFQTNADNRIQPVGTLKPNGFGLFDTLGNANEWTLDLYEFSREEKKWNSLQDGEVLNHPMSNLRGGRYSTHRSEIHTEYEVRSSITGLTPGVGFRIAKTISPSKPN